MVDREPETKASRRARAAFMAMRIAFAAVFAINVQCAVSFIVWPASFTGAYELLGAAGEAAVRGMGVAFLMWNATYPLVIANPARYRALAFVVVVQQVVGLAGESFVLAMLPAGHDALAASIMRFIAFDAAGLVALACTLAWQCSASAALPAEGLRKGAARDGGRADR